jgi:hypothetical protein
MEHLTGKGGMEGCQCRNEQLTNFVSCGILVYK